MNKAYPFGTGLFLLLTIFVFAFCEAQTDTTQAHKDYENALSLQNERPLEAIPYFLKAKDAFIVAAAQNDQLLFWNRALQALGKSISIYYGAEKFVQGDSLAEASAQAFPAGVIAQSPKMAGFYGNWARCC